MPQAVQDIMLTMPTTHFVSPAQAILYRGADFAIVWPQFLTLLAIGGVFLRLHCYVFVRRLERWLERCRWNCHGTWLAKTTELEGLIIRKVKPGVEQ